MFLSSCIGQRGRLYRGYTVNCPHERPSRATQTAAHYGGSDLFMMRKQPNGDWGTPINLGYPINTIDNEGSMVVASNGMTAYYASDRSDSRGLLDLYKFELRKDIRPIRTLYVRGQVRDAKLGTVS